MQYNWSHFEIRENQMTFESKDSIVSLNLFFKDKFKFDFIIRLNKKKVSSVNALNDWI